MSVLVRTSTYTGSVPYGGPSVRLIDVESRAYILLKVNEKANLGMPVEMSSPTASKKEFNLGY